MSRLPGGACPDYLETRKLLWEEGEEEKVAAQVTLCYTLGSC